ncbi:MAG: APC family permease [Cellulosilyticum sp.]|nr:APC family permease [Cellulosilyticum sp.]
MKTQKQYGLLTCIAMIVGVVIGSGIFFKSDNILVATNGSIFLGCLTFVIAAISIIFGSLTIAELAARTDKAGGIITYAEDAYGSNVACAFGWFQLFLYYPTTLAVVCYIIGMYSCMLFGITSTLFMQMIIGLGIALLLAILNIVSKRIAGYVQTSATFIKLIPLVVIGIAGFIFGKPSSALEVSNEQLMGGTWLSALIPIVFAFDGWMVSTSISHEVKNAKKNIPLALISAPLGILFMYLLYFVGLSVYIGPETIMTSGDQHVELAAAQLLGPWAAKGILIFIIISVAGTANGFMAGLFQLPYSLAIRNMLPGSDKIAKINEKYDRSILSCLVAGVITIVWIIVHYVTQTYNLLPNSDISEIAITLNYVLFIGLYFEVFRLSLKGEIKGFFKGKLNPIMAMLGSLIILYVGCQNKLFIFYVAICAGILTSGYLYFRKKNTVSATISAVLEE